MPRVRRYVYQHVYDFDKGHAAAYCDCGLSYRSTAARVGRDPMNHHDDHIHVWRHVSERTLTLCIHHRHTSPSSGVVEDFGKRNIPGKLERRHFSQLSEFERGLISGMKTAGWSTRRVAGQVDRSECAGRNCWEQCTREGTHARKTGSGATRKTTRREGRRIVRQALVDPTVTRSTIRADVGVAIVPQTISRHLAEANFKSKRPFRALPLTPDHRYLRLQWCQARSIWNVTDWQKVVFSDESRFVLGTDDNRVRVWRRPGERYNSPHTVPRHTARTAGVMVWGP
ncbi:transposable element Tc1 transposase [Trichonephila clavipes]|nr:transposable element Tc1 transposase [Trichonephila clavipes]